MPPRAPISLSTPLADIPGVTDKAVRDLRTLGLTNLGRLIAHLPTRHERQVAETDIKDLVVGQVVSARGEVTATRPVRGRKPRFEAVLIDPTGRLDLVWFNMPFLRDQIHPGARLRVQGKLALHNHYPQLANPKWEILKETHAEPSPRGERLRPVYPANEHVTSYRLERLIEKLLPLALPLIEDHLTDDYRQKRHLPSLADAYRMMHAPASEDEARSAHRRLAYDELLLLQLGVHLKRAHLRDALKAPALRWSPAIDRHIRERFPFPLTPGQESVVADLVKDLAADRPMNRLIQGDVGSGKTLVALYAMLMAVASRHQALLMAPTEILAEQHFASITGVLRDSRVSVRLLTGNTRRGERDLLLADLIEGKVDILLGTHALLNEEVRFKSLAVAIIDEQHRFGVGQRARLREKSTLGTPALRAGSAPSTDTPPQHAIAPATPAPGSESRATPSDRTPHVLVMTATPIPRSLAITLFGDLDISQIRGLPPGRQRIATTLAPPDARDMVYDHLAQRVAQGEQAYIVVPVIEPIADDPNVQSIRSLLPQLQQTFLPTLRVGVLHGELDRAARESVMLRFRNRELDVLLATTIIEVGVDVPNATVIVIENADRFGLAQLHQLRGRVGRGERESACILIADPTTDEARERLGVLTSTDDGFVLAEKDLQLRGPGEMFGTRQSGLPPLKVADLMRDLDLLALARRDAAAWISESPDLAWPHEATLRRRLMKQYGQALGLADVG